MVGVATGQRMFVAVVLPDEALEHLDEFLDVRRRAADFRWASREQLHVTLAFLAAVPDRTLDELVERLGRAARSAPRSTPGSRAVAPSRPLPTPAIRVSNAVRFAPPDQGVRRARRGSGPAPRPGRPA